jgi:hypothetical protein
MSARTPVAFLSYVRSDDDHDHGRITVFRKRLEGEVKMQTGKPFPIFQDRNDILWGQKWEERIERSIDEVSFLIPVLTPSFFESPACRKELKDFLLKEATLGLPSLVLPLYYVTCDQPGDSYASGNDPLVNALRERQRTDWRHLRFKSHDAEEVAAEVASLAAMIKESVRDFESQMEAAKSRSPLIIKKGSRPELNAPVAEMELVAQRAGADSRMIEKIDETIKELKNELTEAEGAAALLEIDKDYRIYTRAYDEIVRAEDLDDPKEKIARYRRVARRASHIQKSLGDSLTRDSAKLVTLAQNTSLAVSILIDNSGSMRGRPIAEVAASALILSDVLDASRVTLEILGHTTRAWRGGHSREQWLIEGKPANPGRLNDLRHIIYKAFSDDARLAAPNLGLMLKEGF